MSDSGTNSSRNSEVLRQMHEAAITPSPLTEFLRDPIVLKILTNKKSRRHTHTSGSSQNTSPPRAGERRPDFKRKKSSASFLTQVFAEEEREAERLSSLLKDAVHRLDIETRRGDQAEVRAAEAERRARDAQERGVQSEAARIHSKHTEQDVKTMQLQLDAVRNELRRSQTRSHDLERRMRELELEASKAREAAHKAESALKQHVAREEGKGEGRKVAMRDEYEKGRRDGWEAAYSEAFDAGREEGFEEGREEGFQAGRLDGFEDGRAAGKEEGVEEGWTQGRQETREEALAAFQDYLEEETPRETARPAWVKRRLHREMEGRL